MAANDRFTFGAQYYRPPNPPKQDWDRDLEMMHELGLNTVKYWACWSWISGRKGAPDYSDLDELMGLAAKHQLRVVINIILENAPYWLERGHPEARYRDSDGRAVQLTAAINTPGGGWPGLCFDNLAVQESGLAFLKEIVRRYAQHPALAVWDVWNEPHLEPTWYYPDRLFCYCDASVASFAAWLRHRYGSLDELNHAWARRYSQWSEVESPRAFETYPDFIDWRTFWLENLTKWLQWKLDAVRAIDREHPVMTHVASSAYQGTLVTNIWDEWLLSRPVDMFGTSSFPGWLMADDPALHLFHLEATRDAAAGKPFWQSELQGGRGRREGRTSTSHPDPAAISRWIWTVMAVGAKGCLFWQWRPEMLGPESPGYGLCTPAGEPTERTAAARDMARLLDAFPELVTSRPVPPKAGLLLSRHTALLTCAADRNMDLYATALRGAYRAFHDQNVPLTFLHEDQLSDARVPEGIEYLYWPMPLMADRSLAVALIDFVRGGGTLVAEAAPALHMEHGWTSATVPGQGLHHLFGAEEIEADHCQRVEILLPDRTSIEGEWLVERLRTLGAEVVANFSDGTPALVENRVGEGKAVLIGTFPSLAYEARRLVATGSWISGRSRLALTAVELNPSGQGLLTRLHMTEDGRAVFFAINCGSSFIESIVRLRDLSIEKARVSTGMEFQDGELKVSLRPQEGALGVLEVRASGRAGE